MGELIAILAALFAPVAIVLSEVWESILGHPVFGKYAERFSLIGGLKSLQGLVIQVALIALAFAFEVNIVEMSEFMSRYLPDNPELGQALAALIVGAAMFFYHNARKKAAEKAPEEATADA